MLYDSPNFEVKPMMHFAQNNYTLILTNHKAEDSRSSAIAEKPARRSLSRLSVEMLSYCCTNNANRLRVSLRSTFSNCHVLFRYRPGAQFTKKSYDKLRKNLG